IFLKPHGPQISKLAPTENNYSCSDVATSSFMIPGGDSTYAMDVSLEAPSSGRASAVHNQSAVDAESLTRHVVRARRHEEPDHVGDVLRALHSPQGDLV